MEGAEGGGRVRVESMGRGTKPSSAPRKVHVASLRVAVEETEGKSVSTCSNSLPWATPVLGGKASERGGEGGLGRSSAEGASALEMSPYTDFTVVVQVF